MDQAKLIIQLVEIKGEVERLRADNKQYSERVKFLEEMLRRSTKPAIQKPVAYRSRNPGNHPL